MKYLQKFLCALQGKEKKIMEQLVWCKVKQFLEILRCEDIDRESRVDTQEFQMAKQKLHDKDIVYQQSMANSRRRAGKNQRLCRNAKGVFL